MAYLHFYLFLHVSICRPQIEILNFVITLDFIWFSRLEEFHINRNCVQKIPESIQYLRNVKILQFASNKLSEIPDFLRDKQGTMNIPLDQGDSSNEKPLNNLKIKSNEMNNLNSPLTMLSLRTNNLKGNIILGSYGVSLLFFVENIKV